MIPITETKAKLYIKYMVSLRCKLKVKEELRKLNIKYGVVDLGVVEIFKSISPELKELLRVNLKKSGLDLLDDKKSILIERIQNTVVDMIHFSEEMPKINFSVHISEKLGLDYTYLSNIFAEVKGYTLQNFIIMHKIEKVKELLFYNELNLSEISERLQYSSVAALSNQFKKITGLTPSFYKQLRKSRIVNLENL
ncbi:MAG: AraC family transcriptional regulator [Brumimicrobium sp.]